MISYWTQKKLVCGMPAPFHGDSIWLWSKVLHVVNALTVATYFIVWQIVKKLSYLAATKSSNVIFLSLAVVMAFEVSGWFISFTLVNLSWILVENPDKRPPLHYFACLFVNVGMTFKTPMYY
ncbi:hypothetical protein PENTCL1PPCAC_7698, partial [Pristionchus entomophagus]